MNLSRETNEALSDWVSERDDGGKFERVSKENCESERLKKNLKVDEKWENINQIEKRIRESV